MSSTPSPILNKPSEATLLVPFPLRCIPGCIKVLPVCYYAIIKLYIALDTIVNVHFAPAQCFGFNSTDIPMP